MVREVSAHEPLFAGQDHLAVAQRGEQIRVGAGGDRMDPAQSRRPLEELAGDRPEHHLYVGGEFERVGGTVDDRDRRPGAGGCANAAAVFIADGGQRQPLHHEDVHGREHTAGALRECQPRAVIGPLDVGRTLAPRSGGLL